MFDFTNSQFNLLLLSNKTPNLGTKKLVKLFSMLIEQTIIFLIYQSFVYSIKS